MTAGELCSKTLIELCKERNVTTDKITDREIAMRLAEQQLKNNTFNCSLGLIEKLAECNISKNHTGKWGVIFGRINRTYSFMHKNKTEVLKWIKENYIK